MSVFVYQTFEIKQDKFKEGIENLQEIKKFRNENYNHKVDILTPITGQDHTYALFLTYELASLRRYAVKIDQRLVKPEKVVLQAEKIVRSAEEGHYSIKLQFATERGNLPADVLWEPSRTKQRFYFDASGLYDLEDKRFNWLRRIDKKRVNRKTHWIDFSTLELIRLNAFDELVLYYH